MTLITWQDAWCTHIPLIDHDHKLLVGLTNRLSDAVESNHGRDIIGSVLNILKEYTRTHFVREERLMEKGNYPSLAEHRQEHQRLALQVQEIVAHYQSSQADVDAEALQFLRSWLTNHILGSDMQYLPYVQGVELTREEVQDSMDGVELPEIRTQTPS